MPIRALPPLLVNQIAAGEVIERPASVVKELVENAIDAGAGRIEVAIEQGGKVLIQVRDDGRGIAFEELELAVAPHATSKITDAGDLDAIATLGFRGEALASVASVSRLSVVSRPSGQDEAGRIEVFGEEYRAPRPDSGPPGTLVAVRNLFYNTPARRKFLKTDRTETARCGEIVRGLAMSHPDIGFTLTVDGRRTLDLTPGDPPRRRAVALLGPELEPELLELNDSRDGLAMWGLVGRPGIARASAVHMQTFINGRRVNDRSINHAVREAFRGLIEPDRHPTVILFVVIDPSLVDVNVHPAKAEVRFRDQSRIHRAVLDAVRARLAEADLVPDLRVGGASPAWSPPPAFGPGGGRGQAGAFIDFFRRLDPKQKGFVYGEVKAALTAEAPELLDAPVTAPPADEMLPTVRPVTEVLQVHASYLVTPDPDGLVIIDQHALHERVMFEKLKERIVDGNLESQRLLMPVVIEVDETHIARLDVLKPLLERIGIEAEAMGPRSVAVHAFSTLLFDRGVDPVEFMSDLLASTDPRSADDPEAALHEVLDMMACKAAIKAGDRLEPEELSELLAYRATVERATRCPHGRPTTLKLSLHELDKQFGRR